MRTSLALRALPMLLCCSVPVMAQRTARDPNQASDEWLENCREGRNARGDQRERYCEVKEQRLRATRSLDVDGEQNGGVTIHGWNRSEVLVLSRIQADGEDLSDAREIASAINIQTDGGRIRAEGPSTRRRQSWSVSYDV